MSNPLIIPLEFSPETEQGQRIITEILPGAIELFLAKNKDYKIEGIDIAATLGVRGQWSDMFRKIAKLKQEMWDQDGSGLQFETAEEVIRDLVGHCLLSLLFLKDAKPKTNAEIMQEKMGLNHAPSLKEAMEFRGRGQVKLSDVEIRSESQQEVFGGRPFVGTARKIVDNSQA